MVFQETKFRSPLNRRGGEYCSQAYCAQVLRMKHTLLDYDLHYIKIFYDNTSIIHMTKNANQHSKTKHIKRYHFLRDHNEKGDSEIDYVSTDFQLADIVTKSLNFNRFFFICGKLNACMID